MGVLIIIADDNGTEERKLTAAIQQSDRDDRKSAEKLTEATVNVSST